MGREMGGGFKKEGIYVYLCKREGNETRKGTHSYLALPETDPVQEVVNALSQLLPSKPKKADCTILLL